MPYLIKQDGVTVNDADGESHSYMAGTVLSDWEVSEFVRGKIAEGHTHYREKFEPLTEREAHDYRVKATVAEREHFAQNGDVIQPPFDDYVGLHPSEIIERMRELDVAKVRQVKDYERDGLSRFAIMDFVAPAEVEPFGGYDEMPVREVLEKMSILSDPAVEDIIIYERAHRERPAILEYERSSYEASSEDSLSSSGEEGDKETAKAPSTLVAGASPSSGGAK